MPDAAKHLSGVCGEEVTEADILRLALDGHLTLSVNFANHAYVKSQKVVYFDEEELRNSVKQGIYPPEFKFSNMPFSKDKLMLATRIDEGKFLTREHDNNILEIEGVWDLPMIGGETIYVQSKYHELTGGPSVDLISIDGCFVARNEDNICVLQDSFNHYYDDYYGYRAQWQVQIDKLRRLELSKNNNPRKEKILLLRKEKAHKYYKILADWNKRDNYFEAGNLPEDSILVVRTDALREFEQLISDNEQEKNTTACSSPPNKSELSETERNTMLKLIIGMAIDAYGYDPESTRNSATGDKNGISAKLALKKITISDDTIRKFLKEAKNIL
jgi:hypothetical protein